MHDTVAWYVDHAPMVQHGMEDGQSLVARHIDFIENAEAAVQRALIDGTWAKFHSSVFEGVCADHEGGVHIDMEGNIPARALKDRGQIFGQHVFACGLSPHEQQVFAAEQSRGSLLPDLASIVEIVRCTEAGMRLLGQGIFPAVAADFLQQRIRYIFILQKFKQIILRFHMHHLYSS